MLLSRFLGPVLAAALLLTACIPLPVNPAVNFTPYQNPWYPKEDFERLLNSWKSGRAVPWQIRYRGSAFSDSELVIESTGQGSLGPRLPGAGQQTETFTLSKDELKKLVDDMLASGVFGLYDGHYGAYTQGGGVGGPEIMATVGTLEKRVSKDPSLSSSISLEAGAIQAASDAIVKLALAKLK